MDRKEYCKKWHEAHRDEQLALQKQWYKEHGKQYYKEHRDKMLAHMKQYRKTHRNEILAYNKQWHQQHRDECRQMEKAWRENHKEQWREPEKRHNSKRQRSLGFVPLNEPFEGSEAHHIDKERVIYIPKEYHQSVRHNVWTGRNMALINNLAYDYLLETKALEK